MIGDFSRALFSSERINYSKRNIDNPRADTFCPLRMVPTRGETRSFCLQVHLRSRLIMNGVCVMWRGWIDLERLDGVGCLEYDEKRAAEEDALLRDQLERYNQRVRDFDEKQRAYRSSAAQPPHLNHHHHHHHHHGHHGHHVSGAAAGATGTIEATHLTHRQDPEMEVRLRAY